MIFLLIFNKKRKGYLKKEYRKQKESLFQLQKKYNENFAFIANFT